MTALTLKPEPAALYGGDKQLAVPLLGTAARRRDEPRTRRRFNATRLAQPTDDGFRLFRVY